MKNRRFIIIGVFVLGGYTSIAQPVPAESIQDSVIGWMKIFHFSKPEEGKSINDRFYSAAQLSVADTFSSWIQVSYMPKGGLGDIKKVVAPKPGLYNPNDGALPQSYGVNAKTYTELRYNSSHKLEPVTNSHFAWSIVANGMYGQGCGPLNTPTQYYFTLPSFEEQGYSGDLEKLFDFSTHPVLKKYPGYYQRNSLIGNVKSILLSKDHQFPFVKITKGEYLQVVEDAVARLYKKEKEDIYSKYEGNQKSIDYFMGYLEDKNARRISCLKNNKEKYKNRLAETAEIFTTQPDAMLENYPDVFEGNGGTGFMKLPVYKVDPVRAELCKKDQPQWILISWTPEINDPIGKQLHEAVINNFDFDYCYNYFFDPEKVKGRKYQPLRSPYFKEELVVTEASSATKNAAADKNVFFFEDFSTNAEGQKPIGWSGRLNIVGYSAIVTVIENVPGKWLAIKGNKVLPTKIKGPLPQNFTITYDVAVPQGFTWGAKRLDLTLFTGKATGNSYLTCSVRPGFSGRDGFAAVESQLPEGYSAYGDFAAPGFSNDKDFNRVPVKLKKTGETIEIWINNVKVAKYPKAFPADMVLTGFDFSHNSSNSETEKYFVSNIMIRTD